MIFDAIINLFMVIPYLLLNGIQSLDFQFSLPDNFFDVMTQILSGVGYVFPVGKLLPLFLISINIHVFRVVWALVIRIKSFIPTMGS